MLRVHPNLRLRTEVDWRSYELMESWRYRWLHDDGGMRELRFPAGWVTDLASVPRILHGLIAPTDLRTASLPHDLIYQFAGYVPADLFTIDGQGCAEPWTRRDADRLFGRIMREEDVVRWKRRASYRTVRLLAWPVWNGYAERAIA